MKEGTVPVTPSAPALSVMMVYTFSGVIALWGEPKRRGETPVERSDSLNISPEPKSNFIDLSMSNYFRCNFFPSGKKGLSDGCFMVSWLCFHEMNIEHTVF